MKKNYAAMNHALPSGSLGNYYMMVLIGWLPGERSYHWLHDPVGPQAGQGQDLPPRGVQALRSNRDSGETLIQVVHLKSVYERQDPPWKVRGAHEPPLRFWDPLTTRINRYCLKPRICLGFLQHFQNPFATES